MFAVDLAVMAEDNRAMQTYRSSEGFLQDFLGSAGDHSSHFDSIKRSASEFDTTPERASGPTLAFFEARGLMPVELHRKTPHRTRAVDDVEIVSGKFRLGASGALSKRFQIDLLSPTSGTEYVRRCRTALQLLDQQLHAEFSAFAAHWNDSHSQQLRLTIPQNLTPWIHRYEIHDLELAVDPTSVALDLGRVTDVYTDDRYHDLLASLASMTRMSGVDPATYDAHRLNNLREADLGNRRDEFWIVNSARTLRHHPQRSDHAVKSFFQDVKLAVETILQQRASLSYLERSLSSIRSKTFNASNKDYEEILANVHEALEWYADPVDITENPSNPYFGLLVRRTAAEIGVGNLGDRAMVALDQIVSISTGLSSYGLDKKLSEMVSEQSKLLTELGTIARDQSEVSKQQTEMSKRSREVQLMQAGAALLLLVIAGLNLVIVFRS